MRILVLGDFHGEFPRKFEKIIKKERIDLLLSTGDYLPFSYRKMWFKYCYLSEKPLWIFIGKKKYRQLILRDLEAGERVMKKLNSLGVPVITVLGNVDYPNPDDLFDYKKPRGKGYWAWEYSKGAQFEQRLKKYTNIQRVDYTFLKFGNYVIIGARGHSSPGSVKSKAYRKHRRILDMLFQKFKKENKNRKVIFLTHNLPFGTKLDLIGRRAHESARNKHGGSKMFRRLIEKYQPVFYAGGHIHESKGMQKLGRTVCVNPGAVHEGEGAIVDILEDRKGKIKVKFIK